VKALTKRRLNALACQILLENIVRLVSRQDGEFFPISLTCINVSMDKPSAGHSFFFSG